MKNLIYFSFILILAACCSKPSNQDFLSDNNLSTYNIDPGSVYTETECQSICYDDYEDLDDMDYSEENVDADVDNTDLESGSEENSDI